MLDQFLTEPRAAACADFESTTLCARRTEREGDGCEIAVEVAGVSIRFAAVSLAQALDPMGRERDVVLADNLRETLQAVVDAQQARKTLWQRLLGR